jgi:SAM-dependent methyltransferase
MPWFVDAFGEWYTLVYPHRDEGEAGRFIGALNPHVGWEGRTVLDVGCGNGRYLRSLRASGARPVGLDLSPDLLREARALRESSQGDWPLIRGDMRRLPVAAESFDVVASFFTSFGYFEEAEDDMVLAESARAVRPRGIHVLDTLNRAPVLARSLRDTERVVQGYRVRERRRLEGDGRRIVKAVEVTRDPVSSPVAAYEERVTLYAPEEIRERLRAHGLERVLEWGDYDGAPFDAARSARHVIVSRRVA